MKRGEYKWQKRVAENILGKVEKGKYSLKEYKVRQISICKLAPKGQSNSQQSWFFCWPFEEALEPV